MCLLAQPKEGQQFKNKNNQNKQKIELQGSPTTKEIKKKKKHSSRLLGGAETGSWVREDSHCLAGAGPRDQQIVEQTGQAARLLADPAGPHLHIDKPG